VENDRLRLQLSAGQGQQVTEAVPDLLQAQRDYQASWFLDALDRTRRKLGDGKNDE